ncbi:hypothetical protein B0J14DRAFT_571451 [Halenospora varia]|nr:hypothetical protein B0J14DRAFT_571451 [Halenospora varia]
MDSEDLRAHTVKDFRSPGPVISGDIRQNQTEYIDTRTRSGPGTMRYDYDNKRQNQTTSGYGRQAPPSPPYPALVEHERVYPQLSSSGSEDENENNDISMAPFDVGSGALADDSKLKVSRQKANLEAKLSKTEPATDAPPLPALSLHAKEGNMMYNATTSYYVREDGSDSSADISVHIEYLTNLPISRRRDRSIFRWIHLKQENMDFDIFTRCAREMPSLPEDQVQSVSHFLQRVRKELERSIRSHRGIIGHFMKSGLITKRIQAENSDGSLNRTYVFCSIPYHQLAPYSPLGATSNARLHPVRTLLQSKYPSTTKQRDFEQAVRALSGTPSNHVFNTSNLWCLIINNSDRVKFVPNIPTQPSDASILPQSIQVIINNRVYILPISQCDSWFNFSKYTLSLHEEYIVKWKGAQITAELWPLIVQQAQREIIYIFFSSRKRPITYGLEEGAIEEDLDDLIPGGAKAPQTTESDLNATNPAVKIEPSKPRSDRELVNTYLTSVHSWLENQKNKRASTLYRKGSQKPLDDVERAMQGMLRSRLDLPEIDAAKSSLIEAVKSIFSLFLPLDQRNIMCSKLWGALHMAITAAIPEDISWQLNRTIETLGQAAVVANTIKAQLSGGNAPPPEALSMPPDALRAWHQLLLCILFWLPRSMGPSQRHASKTVTLLQKTHKELMNNPKAKKLENVEAVLPNGLLAVIISHIITDFTGTQPGLSYMPYISDSRSQIQEIKVTKEPLNHHNQTKITAFISEVKIVMDSLERQQTVVDKIDDEFARQEGKAGVSDIDRIRPPDLAQLFLREAGDSLWGKINSIQELLEKSQKLLESNAEAVRHNKDKHDAAIYTFTVVTIIFLPISTVASVLGMNTYDVRNMNETQWLFWSIALPLTAVVIIVSLFAARIIALPFRKGVELSFTGDETKSIRRRRTRGAGWYQKPEYAPSV